MMKLNGIEIIWVIKMELSKMKDAKFIFVHDKDTKEQLEKSGFRLFRKDGNRWIFFNDKTKNFENIKGAVYSNILTF